MNRIKSGRERAWLITNCSLLTLSFLGGYFGLAVGQKPSLSWLLILAFALLAPALIVGSENFFLGHPAGAPSLTGSVFGRSGFFQFTFIVSLAHIAIGIGELLSGLPILRFAKHSEVERGWRRNVRRMFNTYELPYQGSETWVRECREFICNALNCERNEMEPLSGFDVLDWETRVANQNRQHWAVHT